MISFLITYILLCLEFTGSKIALEAKLLISRMANLNGRSDKMLVLCSNGLENQISTPRIFAEQSDKVFRNLFPEMHLQKIED